MQKKDPHREKVFLKYFFSTYIPPFTIPIPTSEEVFKDIYLSALTVWDGFGKALDRYTFSHQLKTKLVKLFELWDDLWEKYLCVTTDDLQMGDMAFRTWTTERQIQGRWNEIRMLARDIDQSAKVFYKS